MSWRAIRDSTVIEQVFYSWVVPRQPPFHVWVDLTGRWSVPAPGVLLAWRHSDRRGWEAWVVRVESYSTGTGSEVLMSQSWVSAALVRPADDRSEPRGQVSRT